MLSFKKTSMLNYLLYGGIVLFGGGIFYIYKRIFSKSYLNKEDLKIIKELNQESDENLNTEIAIKLLALINRKTDEYINKNFSHLENERRDVWGNEVLYERKCLELFRLRNNTYKIIYEQVLREFGVDKGQFGEYLQGISPVDIDKKMITDENPEFEFNKPPDRVKVKEAFMHYAKYSIKKMEEFKKISNNQISINDDEVLNKLMIMKFRIDDDLFKNFKITEQQLRYLLIEYNLNEDQSVKEILDQMGQFEENKNNHIEE